MAAALAVVALSPGVAAAAPTGALTQLLAPNDCISDLASTCGTMLAVANAGFSYQAIVSPDGRNVYWIANNDSLHEFARNPSTGALTALASPNDCITDAATGCGTVMAPGMGNPGALAISHDGAFVYVATQADNSIAEFSRDPTSGALTEIGCLSESDANCHGGLITGMAAPYGITITPNGQNVYVSAASGSVAEFTRDTATGALTQLAPPDSCVATTANACGTGNIVDAALNNAIGVNTSPDGSDVYVSDGGISGGGNIDQFSVGTGGALVRLGCIGNAASGCADLSAIGLNGTEDLAFTPNGQFAYGNAFSDSDVSEFSRNATTGVLTYLGCVGSAAHTPGSECSTVANGTDGPLGVAVSPDGVNLYVSSTYDQSEGAFSINPATGLLTQLPAPNDCLELSGGLDNGNCSVTTATGLAGARRVTVSPDGLNVYVAGQNSDALVELARTPAPSALTITSTPPPSSVSVGQTITTTFTVTDGGPDGEAAVTFSDALPSNVAFVSASTSTGATCTGTTTIICNLGYLGIGASDTVTVTVRATAPGTATETATVTGTTPEANATNNTVSATTAVASAPPRPTGLPDPVFRRTANLLPVSGTVFIKLPGKSAFVRVTGPIQIPIGTIINATHGRVTLVFALPNGKTETIILYGGEFRIASQSASGLITFVLVGPFLSEPYSRVHALMMSRSVPFAPVQAIFAKHHPKTVKTRSLWGSENSGQYTTQGDDGAATVRGTQWVTEDFKGFSRFYVAKGRVTVTDFRHRHRKINLRAGQCYQTSTPKHCTPSPFERSGG